MLKEAAFFADALSNLTRNHTDRTPNIYEPETKLGWVDFAIVLGIFGLILLIAGLCSKLRTHCMNFLNTEPERLRLIRNEQIEEIETHAAQASINTGSNLV